jgi:hypothetical protein
MMENVTHADALKSYVTQSMHCEMSLMPMPLELCDTLDA